MRIFITGAAGMVGSHLVDRLAPSEEVLGSIFRPTIRVNEIQGKAQLVSLDVRDWPSMRKTFEDFRPEVVYHLAAQSLPTVSWSNPWETMDINVQGTVNVFEAIRHVRNSGAPSYNPMVVVACSSAEYGASLTPDRIPIREDAPLLPLHPYGVSKVAQDLLAFQYWQNYGIRCIRARIFNTTGTRKRADVVSDFSMRVAQIMRNGGSLRVGNLQTKRAITDVRDLISALVLLAERGDSGDVYNICGSQAYQIGDLIPIFERLAGKALPVAIDPALIRPSDEPVIFGSAGKLQLRTGWKQSVTLEQTLHDMLEYALAHPQDNSN